MLKLERHICGPLANNVYLFYDPKSLEAMLIDPGIGSEYLAENIGAASLNLKYIVNTHGHFDHTFNNAFFKKKFPEAQLAIHKGDVHMLKAQTEMATMFGFDAESSPEPDLFLYEGQKLALGEFQVEIIEVPGHSPGGIALVYENIAIVGDALFEGSIGRTDLPGANHRLLLDSIMQKLLVLPDSTEVYPGHGNATRIGEEKASNPFLK